MRSVSHCELAASTRRISMISSRECQVGHDLVPDPLVLVAPSQQFGTQILVHRVRES
jgi:hypothetical protein